MIRLGLLHAGRVGCVFLVIPIRIRNPAYFFIPRSMVFHAVALALKCAPGRIPLFLIFERIVLDLANRQAVRCRFNGFGILVGFARYLSHGINPGIEIFYRVISPASGATVSGPPKIRGSSCRG